MRERSKRSPRRGTARATEDGSVQLDRHYSSAGSGEQHRPWTDDFPLKVLLIAQRGDQAFVVVNGLAMVLSARGLVGLRAMGHARCMCGRCSEAVVQ